MVRRLNATDDQAGEIDEGGEQEFMGVLLSSNVGKESVEEFGAEGILQGAAQHDGERAPVHEALKDLPEEHGLPPCHSGEQQYYTLK
jgi:hypothetical protein